MKHHSNPLICARAAARRPEYHARGNCDCHGCRETEQLEDTAHFGPTIECRMVAMGFLKALDDLRAGRLGAVDLSQCFD